MELQSVEGYDRRTADEISHDYADSEFHFPDTKTKMRPTEHDFSGTLFAMSLQSGEWQGAKVEFDESENAFSYRIQHDQFTFERSLAMGPHGRARFTGAGLTGSVEEACIWLTKVDHFDDIGCTVDQCWTTTVAEDHAAQFEREHGECMTAFAPCESIHDFIRMRRLAGSLEGRATVYRLGKQVMIVGAPGDVALVKFAA